MKPVSITVSKEYFKVNSMMKNFDHTMKELGQKVKKLRIEIDGEKDLPQIPRKVLIDLKNYTKDKYIETSSYNNHKGWFGSY